MYTLIREKIEQLPVNVESLLEELRAIELEQSRFAEY
jgi:hypothetical protein